MRVFLPYLTGLLLSIPALAQAQAAAEPTAAPQPLASSEAAPPSGATDNGIGCGAGYAGYVKSGEKGLAGASVLVKGKGSSVLVVTNSDGFFVLPATVRGWPTLAVSAMGYEPAIITYDACEPVTVDLKVAAGTKFKKYGRKKGHLVLSKRK